MIVVITILSMLLLGVIATLIRYYPSYKWNHTCRLMYMEFETGYLDNLHKLIETYGVDINRMFETSCLEDIDKEIKMPSIHKNLTPEERVSLLKKIVIDEFNKIKAKENIIGDELKKYEKSNPDWNIVEVTNNRRGIIKITI